MPRRIKKIKNSARLSVAKNKKREISKKTSKKKSRKVDLEVRVEKTVERREVKRTMSDIKSKGKIKGGSDSAIIKKITPKKAAKKQAKKEMSHHGLAGEDHEKAELIHYAKVEREKRLIMWSGVTFFMVLVVFLWIFNINKIFKKGEAENFSDTIQIKAEWDKATEDIGDSINRIKEDLAKLREVKLEAVEMEEKEGKQTTELEDNPAEQIKDSDFDKEGIRELKNKLEEQIK